LTSLSAAELDRLHLSESTPVSRAEWSMMRRPLEVRPFSMWFAAPIDPVGEHR
jgi:hypothetical protein